MIVTLKTEKLEVGMFIDLSACWYKNPFWVDSFEITSENQIRKIINAGIKKVNVDSLRSDAKIEGLKDVVIEDEAVPIIIKAGKAKTKKAQIAQKGKGADASKIQIDEEPEPALRWEPENFMPADVVQVVNDKNLPPDIRAKGVYRYSLEMMKYLFENPTDDVIKTTKEGIRDVVDIILTETGTSSNLIKVVSNDSHVYTHSVNVGIKSILLAKSLYESSDEHDIYELGASFFLHDIGKIKIGSDIINKEGKLTAEEFEIMKTHPFQGYKILSDLRLVDSGTWIVSLHHHERADGSGYPARILGKDIHPYARICCIADVYDALTARRAFKKKQNKPVEALTIMKNEMLAHFNAKLLTSFILLFK